jgi:cation:H+ antiporter
MNFAALLLGLTLLLFSAGWFIQGASTLAEKLRIPPLIIGMIIIGFGTSTPELLVSTQAALEGNHGLAIGNAVGSNITNIALILGLTAVLAPIAVQSIVVRRELPILLVATLLLFFLVRDAHLSRFDAGCLMAAFTLVMAWTFYQAKQTPDDALAEDVKQELGGTSMGSWKAAFLMVGGLILLMLSSRLLVWSAVKLATALGVNDLLIGLTIVALGTSLPELASSVMVARKGEHDLALGNVLGSNLFNTLVVVGVAGLAKPIQVLPNVLKLDLPVLLLVTGTLLLVSFGIKGPGRINRFEGFMFLGGFGVYTLYLILTNLA